MEITQGEGKPAKDGSPHVDLSGIVVLFGLIATAWSLFLFLLNILGWHVARTRYRGLRQTGLHKDSSVERAPGVTIIRPCKGLETNLDENLESTFDQDYPTSKLQIFLAFQDEHDAALPLVRRLMEKYPDIESHITFSRNKNHPLEKARNPKIENISECYRTAKYDLLWIVDSNVQVGSDTLARSVEAIAGLKSSPFPGASAHFRSKEIGLIHHLPHGAIPTQELGSQLELCFLNTAHARMYLAINTVAVDSCVMGKSNMMRKSDLEQIGGLSAFAAYIAEDNMIGKAIWDKLDKRHELSCNVARTAIGPMSFGQYIERRVRWIRVRKNMVVVATLLEPFTESIVAGVIAGLGLKALFACPVWLYLPFHLLGWFLLDRSVFRTLVKIPVYPLVEETPHAEARIPYHKLENNTPAFAKIWLLRELLALPIWLYAMLGNNVRWRGAKYRVLPNGEAILLE